MKLLLSTLGIISLLLGIIGAFLPILPTVPFILLSAFLFSRSSPKLHAYLLNNPVFGKYIRDYNEHKSIPLKIKILSISMLWVSILLSMYILMGRWYLQVLLLGIASFATIHILRIKTKVEK